MNFSRVTVAVIVPTADRPVFLHRALRSVVAQTLEVAEIIVVDNGASEAQLDSELHGKVTYIRTDLHIGPSRARNIGANAALSEYLAFLDDDDIWHENFIEVCASTIANKGADVVVGRLDRMREGGIVSRYKMFPDDPEEQRRLYFSNPGFGGQNIVIRRDAFFEVGGFDVRMPASTDRDLAVRLLQAGKRIRAEHDTAAILCDHQGSRVRDKLVKGNAIFIAKHWRCMKWAELYRAARVLLSRYFNFIASRSRVGGVLI